MVDHTLRERLLLYLSTREVPETGPAPRATAPAGILEALGMGTETLADRVALLSTLSDLEHDGLARSRSRRVGGLDGERAVYEITDAGLTRAREVHDRLAGVEVTVETVEGSATVSLADVEDHVDLEGRAAMARALGRLEEGVLPLDPDGPGSEEEQFVDRDEELAWLDDRVRGSTAGVLVTGEPGVGKTTLVDRLEQRLAPEATFLRGRCESDVVEPYGPLLEAVAGLPDGPERERMLAHLADAPTVDVEDPETLDAERTARFAAVADALEGAAEDGPLVVVVDDAQWIDDPTALVCQTIVDRLDRSDLLLVAVARAGALVDDHPLAGPLEGWERRALEPFDREDTGRLAGAVTGASSLPESFVAALQDATGGNPLFVAESVAALLESGDLDPALSVYPDLSAGLPVTDAVEAAIGARLEALSPTAREVLEVASVAGETVELDVLSALLDDDAPTVRAYVDLLEDGDVVTTVDDGARVRFPSAVVRGAVLDDVGPARRRELHREVAETLRERHGDDEHAARIAHHFDAAEAPGEALQFYVRAGERAEGLYAHEAAIEHYERAVAIARDREATGTLLAALERVGTVHAVLGETEEALRCLRYVGQHAPAVETRQRSLRKRSLACWTLGDHDRALECAEEGLALSESPGASPVEECQLLDRKGLALFQTGREADALDAYERALDIATDVDADRERARALEGIGKTRYRMGEIDAAREPLERSMALWEAVVADTGSTRDRRSLGTACNTLGAVHMRAGEFDAAVEAYERAESEYSEIGYRRGRGSVLNNLGILYQKRGEPVAARETYAQALEIHRQLEDRQGSLNVYVNLGSVCFDVGQLDRAVEYSRRAVELAEQIGDPGGIAAAQDVLASSHYYRNDLEAMADVSDRQLALTAEIDDKLRRVNALETAGLLRAARDDLEGALSVYREALEIAETHDAADKAATARARLLEALVERGDLAAAREHVETFEAVEQSQTGHVGLAAYYAATGDEDRAEEILAEGIASSEAAGTVTHEAYLRTERAELALERGERDRARERAEAARALAAEHGLELLVERCETVLASA